MGRSSDRRPPDIRVIDGTGRIDTGALQRRLDGIRGTSDIAHSSAVSGLADTGIEVIRIEKDPTVSPGIAASVGSIAMRVRPGSPLISSGHYIKVGQADTAWHRLVQMGERSHVMMPMLTATATALTLAGTNAAPITYAMYIGRALTDISSITVRWELLSAGVKLTAGQLAIATSIAWDPPVDDNTRQPLTVVGYTDIISTLQGTAPLSYNTDISIRELPAGSDIWILMHSATDDIQPTVRAVVDYMRSGLAATSSTKPSTTIGRSTQFTHVNSGDSIPNMIAYI